MTKKRIILLAVLAALMSFACIMFAACNKSDPEPETYTVKWTVDSNVTVTVEDYTELPTSVEEGTVIKFTVAPKTGYEIASVTGARRSGSSYSLTVSADVEVVITARKAVMGLTVTGFDETKQYLVGDEIDLTGVEVKATYVDGDVTVPLKEGSADGYTVTPATFMGGEKSVTFSYGGQTQSFTIPAVEYLVTIDIGKGATFSSDLLSKYADLNNYNHDATNGVITFTYLDVEEEIVLPTEEDFSREYYSFLGWTDASSTVKKITATTAESITLTARWEYQPVIVNNVRLEVKNVGDPAVEVPYLVIEGTFNGATEAQLYLLEGNKDISMYGTKVTKSDTDEFTLEFDLTQLQKQVDEEDQPIDFLGAWCDIRFNATVDGKEESMPIHITEGQTIVNTSQKIRVGNYNYLFAVYTSNGDSTLKVYYNDAFYNYTVTFEEKQVTTGEGNNQQTETVPTITIAGTILDEKYFGKTIRVSWWITSESPVDSATIGANGEFSIEIDARDIPLGSNGYAHLTILDTDGTTVLYGGTSMNFLHGGSETEFPALDKKVGEMTNALRFAASDGKAYYVGYAWEGLMVYARDEQVMLDTASLVTKTEGEGETEKVYLKLTGTYSQTKFTTEEAAKTAIETNLQFEALALGDWTTVTSTYVPKVVIGEDGTFEIYVVLDNAADGQTVFFHKQLGFAGDTTITDNNLGTGNVSPEIGSTVTSGGLVYTLLDANTLSESWQKTLIAVEVTAE